MKFQQLPIGARFEYEGRVYVKTGPLSAASDEDGTRMIPRYVELTPLDGTPSAARPKTGRKLDEAVVMTAFEAFYGTCSRLADDSGRLELAAARQRFLETLR